LRDKRLFHVQRLGSVRKGPILVYLKLIFTAIFWGGTFVAGRIVALEIGPFSASFLRFVIASVCLIASLILDEPLTPSLLVGAILVLTGITLTNLASARAVKSSASPLHKGNSDSGGPI
jgi:drug/metabolite transporter (DMT)-like permease